MCSKYHDLSSFLGICWMWLSRSVSDFHFLLCNGLIFIFLAQMLLGSGDFKQGPGNLLDFFEKVALGALCQGSRQVLSKFCGLQVEPPQPWERPWTIFQFCWNCILLIGHARGHHQAVGFCCRSGGSVTGSVTYLFSSWHRQFHYQQMATRKSVNSLRRSCTASLAYVAALRWNTSSRFSSMSSSLSCKPHQKPCEKWNVKNIVLQELSQDLSANFWEWGQ